MPRLPRPLRLLLPWLLYALVQVASGGVWSSAAVVFLVACPLQDCGPDARLLWGLAWGSVAIGFAALTTEEDEVFETLRAVAAVPLAVLAAVFTAYSEAPGWTAASAAPLWGWLLLQPGWVRRRLGLSS